MKHLVPVAIVASACVAGCHQNQRTQYATAQELFIQGAQACIHLRTTGKISAETYRTDVDPYIQLGNRILDDWDAASLAGDANGITVARAALQQVTAHLAGIEATAMKEAR